VTKGKDAFHGDEVSPSRGDFAEGTSSHCQLPSSLPVFRFTCPGRPLPGGSRRFIRQPRGGPKVAVVRHSPAFFRNQLCEREGKMSTTK